MSLEFPSGPSPEDLNKASRLVEVAKIDMERMFVENEEASDIFFPGANLRNANLKEIVFHSRRDLSGADLSGAILESGSFTGSNLSNAMLCDANLQNAGFIEANLAGANLTNANCEGAWFSGANLENANLQGASLIDANLAKTNLQGANLEGTILSNAIYHNTTIWPKGFDPQQAGAIRQTINDDGSPMIYED